MFSGIRRVGLIAGAGILAVALSAAPVAAYSRENWQVGFAGTASGGSFGFWGWCAFAGGVNSGNDGDCQFSQYIHSPQFWVTCEVSLDITSWTRSHDFLFTGHASVNPSSLTGPCVSLFPGSVNFTNADSGIPGAAGHYHLNGAFGPGSELQIQVTQVP